MVATPGLISTTLTARPTIASRHRSTEEHVVPESKGRPKAKQKKRQQDPYAEPRAADQPNPPWFLPVMLGLMIVGLLWVVVFYLVPGNTVPLPIGSWNLVVGLGIVMAGFMMSTRWR